MLCLGLSSESIKIRLTDIFSMNIFITGVSSGIGLELAKKLVQKGHIIWGVARREKSPQKNFLYTVCDVSKSKDVARVMQEFEKKNFIPDVVILNAAVFKEDLYPNYNHSVAKEVFSVNLFGSLIWVESLLPKFLRRGSGQFIGISSVSALRPDPFCLSYSASKAALSMAFRTLRLRYTKDNIFFKVIFFGPVATPMSVYSKLDESGKTVSKKFFVGDPHDAAKVILRAITEKREAYYFPYFLMLLVRFTSFLPDSLFSFLGRLVKRQ